MTVAIDVRTRYSQARSEVLQLASMPMEAYRTGALLLRGSPVVARFLAGWLSANSRPMSSRVTPCPVRCHRRWAGRRRVGPRSAQIRC